MVEVKEKCLHHPKFCPSTLSDAVLIALFGRLCLQGPLHLCLHMACDPPELGPFSPFQNLSSRSLTKPRAAEISYSQEPILLNFYLPPTF